MTTLYKFENDQECAFKKMFNHMYTIFTCVYIESKIIPSAPPLLLLSAYKQKNGMALQ